MRSPTWHRASFVFIGPFFAHAFRPPWHWRGSQIYAVCYGAIALIILATFLVDRIRHGRDGFKARWEGSWPCPLRARLLDLLAALGLGMGAVVAWYLLTG